MSLKELTKEKHAAAESTAFMRAVFDKTLPESIWIDWTYQKTLFYGTLEGAAGSNGLLRDLPDIRRAFYIYQDFAEMNQGKLIPSYRPSVIDYHNYLLTISKDADKIMAHLYTWHMGDMYGGQMIKKIIPGSHRSLEFKNTRLLVDTIRSRLDDSMAEESNRAFDWAILMMKEYDSSLG